MLLKTYLNGMGIVGFGSRGDTPCSIPGIARFEFGSRYTCVMFSGAMIEFNNLRTLIECIHDEFKAAPTFGYRLSFTKRRGDESLTLLPVSSMGRPWGRNIKRLIEDLTIWTTEYNMTGAWSDEAKARAAQSSIPRDPPWI